MTLPPLLADIADEVDSKSAKTGIIGSVLRRAIKEAQANRRHVMPLLVTATGSSLGQPCTALAAILGQPVTGPLPRGFPANTGGSRLPSRLELTIQRCATCDWINPMQAHRRPVDPASLVQRARR